jgi:hypothetical protein
MKNQVVITLQYLAYILANFVFYLVLVLSDVHNFTCIRSALAYHIVLQGYCLNIFVLIVFFLLILVYLHFDFCYVSRRQAFYRFKLTLLELRRLLLYHFQQLLRASDKVVDIYIRFKWSSAFWVTTAATMTAPFYSAYNSRQLGS